MNKDRSTAELEALLKFADERINKLVDAQSAQAAPQAVRQEPWCPDVCPITGRKFFMWLEHWETGKDVPTYGGPYDSYTIPVKDSDGTFSCERYDHDAGEWMTEGMGWECVGLKLCDDQAFIVEPSDQRYMEIEHFATHPTQQGLDAQRLTFTLSHLLGGEDMTEKLMGLLHDSDGLPWAYEIAVGEIDAVLAAQAKQGEQA